MIAGLKGYIQCSAFGFPAGIPQGMNFCMRSSGLFMVAFTYYLAVFDHQRSDTGIRRGPAAALSGLPQCHAHIIAIYISHSALSWY